MDVLYFKFASISDRINTHKEGAMMKQVHINDLKTKLDDINLIDIRETLEFHSLPKLAQAKHIPMQDLVSQADQYLSKDECYYLICRSGARTEQVTAYLSSLGYDVVNVLGGMLEYRK